MTERAARGELCRRTLLLTLAMEAVTILFRFGLDLQATRDTADTIGRLTGGLRIHHAYIGLLVLVLSLSLRNRPALFRWALAVGLALCLSDLIHHFLVLWPIVGDPEWHLVYPE